MCRDDKTEFVTLCVTDGYTDQVHHVTFSTPPACIGNRACHTSPSLFVGGCKAAELRIAMMCFNLSLRVSQKFIPLVNKRWTSDNQAFILFYVVRAESLGIEVLAVNYQSRQWLQDQFIQVSHQNYVMLKFHTSDLVAFDNSFPIAPSSIFVTLTTLCGSCCGKSEPVCVACLTVSTKRLFSDNLFGNATPTTNIISQDTICVVRIQEIYQLTDLTQPDGSPVVFTVSMYDH